MSSANRAASNGHSQASSAQLVLALRSDGSVFSGKLIHRLIATGMVWPTRVIFTLIKNRQIQVGSVYAKPAGAAATPGCHDLATPARLGSKSRRFSGLKRDEIGLNHHRALAPCLSMIFWENRFTLFRIML
ncbi:hypothetical protein [Bradyrhizobium elkanii]|uniref:hypothetical protein n=1 Tax=Bradyrhizobium elkanii TaxID=29448 RepID=UPI0012FD1105|nr:hypothetical protein [Bradyrhizobium elkanii]WLA82297.1 hypothetical protein QNJ99_44370 [Bradyrhizobium elkanii]